MTKVTYELNGKIIEIDLPDDKAKEYLEFKEGERKAEEREKWRQRKKINSLEAMSEANEVFSDKRADFEDSFVLSDELQQALFKLTEGQRKVVKLYYFCGYTYAEIAKELQLDKASVGQQLKRALKNLKKILNNFE